MSHAARCCCSASESSFPGGRQFKPFVFQPRVALALFRSRTSPKRTTPLATTSDLLISLESSDEEDEDPSKQGGRQSMPYSQQPRFPEQQIVRRQTAEGHVSPPKTTAFGSTNGNVSSAGTASERAGTIELRFLSLPHFGSTIVGLGAKAKFSPSRC